MVKFRFQDFEIWQLSIKIADELFGIADSLEERRLYRFAEQLKFLKNPEIKSFSIVLRAYAPYPLRSALCS